MERFRVSPPVWLETLLNDPKVTDICLNGPDHCFSDQGNGLEWIQTDRVEGWTESSFRDWILFELSQVGKTWDAKYPFVDATLRTGHRIHVAFPPLARQGILISLRRLPHLSALADQPRISGQNRWSNSPLYCLIAKQVKQGDSVLISGATGSGKTTLASDLLSEVSPTERIIALEDTPELCPPHPHFISLTSRTANSDGYGEVTLRTLLKQTLRMRPDRIVLGECRGDEVLELLQALNTGHRGALGTLHANSPRDALRRIELLCTLASGGALPLLGIRELLSVGIQWIVQVVRDQQERKISECWKVEGREGDTILMRQVVQSKIE